MVIAASRLWRQGVIVTAVLFALAGKARADTCSPPGTANVQPPIRFETQTLPPTYANNLTRRQLSAIDQGNNHAGLTQTQTAFAVRPSLRFSRVPDGRICAYVSEIEASWRVTQMRVDVASEYRAGTCPYREVLEHENQHVQIAKSQFAVTEQILRSRLSVQVEKIRPFIITGTPDQAARDVAARLMNAMQPVLELNRLALERANAEIDTQENYRKVTARCADW